jgi:hypothetical protein
VGLLVASKRALRDFYRDAVVPTVLLQLSHIISRTYIHHHLKPSSPVSLHIIISTLFLGSLSLIIVLSVKISHHHLWILNCLYIIPPLTSFIGIPTRLVFQIHIYACWLAIGLSSIFFIVSVARLNYHIFRGTVKVLLKRLSKKMRLKFCLARLAVHFANFKARVIQFLDKFGRTLSIDVRINHLLVFQLGTYGSWRLTRLLVISTITALSSPFAHKLSFSVSTLVLVMAATIVLIRYIHIIQLLTITDAVACLFYEVFVSIYFKMSVALAFLQEIFGVPEVELSKQKLDLSDITLLDRLIIVIINGVALQLLIVIVALMLHRVLRFLLTFWFVNFMTYITVPDQLLHVLVDCFVTLSILLRPFCSDYDWSFMTRSNKLHLLSFSIILYLLTTSLHARFFSHPARPRSRLGRTARRRRRRKALAPRSRP